MRIELERVACANKDCGMCRFANDVSIMAFNCVRHPYLNPIPKGQGYWCIDFAPCLVDPPSEVLP